MYKCNFYCRTGHAARRLSGVVRERHPLAFPLPGPECPDCGRLMSLSSFVLAVDGSGCRPHRHTVRRSIGKGQLSLFPDYQG